MAQESWTQFLMARYGCDLAVRTGLDRNHDFSAEFHEGNWLDLAHKFPLFIFVYICPHNAAGTPAREGIPTGGCREGIPAVAGAPYMPNVRAGDW